MLNVGSRKQLFIDDRFIDESDAVSLTMNPPRQPPEPVLVADRPWEKLGLCLYNTVLREPNGLFRMWYGAMLKHGLPQEGAIRLCYAESDDGVNWRKPSLGIVEFEGSKDNNIVAPHDERQSMQGACVYRDARTPGDELYKLMTKFRPNDDELRRGAMPGLWSMHSPDGINWEWYPDQPNPPEQACDTQNVFWWDDSIKKYVCYTRDWGSQGTAEAAEFDHGGSTRFRAVARMTSDDFRNWAEPELVFKADACDLEAPTPDNEKTEEHNVDFYNNCAIKYEEAQDVYVMMPSAYHHWTRDMLPGTFDVQLLTSRDGINWRRQGNREPFLRLGLSGSRSSGMIMANPWLIPMGGELWHYYTGEGKPHAESPQGPEDSGIFRAVSRLDGFVSLDAGFEVGGFTTPPLIFSGNQLVLNFDAGSGGWMKIELLDTEGEPIKGRSYEDADALTGNHIAKTATWRSNPDVGMSRGSPIRLRVTMRSAKLYAFQFAKGTN